MPFKALLVFSLLLTGLNSFAYPSYISYGYQSCMNCHYNPYGNGPLTDYGRAVGATAISDRLFWSKKASEEDVAAASGFWFSEAKNEHFRPSLSYRGLQFAQNFDQANPKYATVTMDLSATGVLKFLSDDRLLFVGNIGYAPVPMALAATNASVDLYRSHEVYAGYRPVNELGIYVGLMDKIFGIRIPDHISYSRTLTQLTQYDQSYAILLHYLGKKIEFGVQPFIGNLVQAYSLRQQGVAAQLEYQTSTFSRVGASIATSASDYLAILMAEAHAKVGLGEGNSILFETGLIRKATSAADSYLQNYVFSQGAYNLRRGLFALLTLEEMYSEKSPNNMVYRIGPGLQYFPVQRVEIRMDVYNTLVDSATSGLNTSWMSALQLHLWF